MKSAIARAALHALGWLPLPLLHGLGTLVGGILNLVPNDAARLTRLHLRRCLPDRPEAERRRIACASLRHFACATLEAPAIWYGPRRRLLRWLNQPQSAARLRATAAHGGALVLCPHLGAWELAGMFCARQGPITSMYKPQKGVFEALIHAGRERLGADLVPSDAGGVRALLAALKRGEMIGLLPDQDPPTGSGSFAPLFGIAAHTPTLVSKLAGRSGAPVCFCYARRRSWGRGFEIIVEPLPAALDTPAALNAAVESLIRRLPEQYWWGYRRYRRRPAGEADFYAGLRDA